MKIENLFTTPIARTHYVCSQETYDFLNNQEMRNNNIEYGSQSVNTRILNEPQCDDLANFILDKVNTFAKEVMGYDTRGFQFVQSWVSHKNPGHGHGKHSHGNSVISGVYYFHINKNDKILPLCFHREAGVYGANQIHVPTFPPRNNDPYFWQQVEVHPSQYDIILFPSFLPHSVPRNDSFSVRKSFAFNLVPLDFLGIEEGLTQLKYDTLK